MATNKRNGKVDYGMSEEALKYQLLELRLAETLQSLKLISKQHNVLQKDFRVLSDKYTITKECCMDTAWRYCPRHSEEFQSMPLQDKYLVETEGRIGEYNVLEKLGEGQFSVVKRCKKITHHRSSFVGCDSDEKKMVAIKVSLNYKHYRVGYNYARILINCPSYFNLFYL